MKLADLPDGIDVEPISNGEGHIVPAVTVGREARIKRVAPIQAAPKAKRVVENAA